MSSPATASTPLDRRDWLWLLAIWGIAATTLVLRSFIGDPDGPLFSDTDDAMRMVVVRDFLNGQNWYDTIQHRLNTPFGADIHWSRLVDLPLAALLFLAGLVLPAPAAMQAAGIIWPLLLLFALLWISARTTLELAGREALLPALVLPILSPAVLAEFMPGRADHHNVIVVLAMACLLTSVLALRRPLMAWLAGFFTATALAIAIEAMPAAIAAILAFGLAYAADPARRDNLRRFGFGFAGFMLLHFALARPPAQWLEAACDMISPVYVLAALAVGAAYGVVSILPPPRTLLLRLSLLAGFGIAAAALVALVYPQCLAGPYSALDPFLRDNWIAAIVEARPWHQSIIDLPGYSLGVAAPVLLGLVVGLVAFRRETVNRPAWLILLVFIACTAAIMLVQIRGARLAILPAIPAASWLIVRARHLYLDHPRAGSVLALVGAWLVSSGIVLVLLVNAALALLPPGRALALAEARADRQYCLAPSAFVDLKGLPPERIMAPIDLGSHILLETPHAVVAAPYHRNQDGILDAMRFFNRSPEEARAIAQRRGLGLVVTCDAMPEMHTLARDTDGTLLNLLINGTPPDWLEDVSLDGPLRIYAILP